MMKHHKYKHTAYRSGSAVGETSPFSDPQLPGPEGSGSRCTRGQPVHRDSHETPQNASYNAVVVGP